MTGIVGRAGDAVKVRGMFVVAKQAEQVFVGFEAVSRFQIIVDRRENRDEMKLNVELKDPSDDKNMLSGEINRKFQDFCRVKLDNIEYVAPGVIPESRKTIEDVRKWD
jgi:phenylacetate-CoA ligase